LIMAAIIFFVLGFTDMIAAIRYRKDSSGWQTTLSSGIVTLLVGVFMGFTVYMPVAPMTTVTVLCAWAVIRCLLTLVGVIMGKVRRKGTIISSCVLGVAGILIFIFRDVIAASTAIIGYGLMGVGAVLMVIGFYRRAAGNEKTEVIVQQQREEKKHDREEKLVNSINEKAHLRGLAEGYDNMPEEDTADREAESSDQEKDSSLKDKIMDAVETEMDMENSVGIQSLAQETADEESVSDADSAESEELSENGAGSRTFSDRVMKAVETEMVMEESVRKEAIAEEGSESPESEEGASPEAEVPETGAEPAPEQEAQEEEQPEEKKGLKAFFSRF
ncbi:MAG: hypothetical protein IK115_02565, partial [Lachnospiraceae bacterium]|nr:hypothetical protein [Lachnospiraceae bacterium]